MEIRYEDLEYIMTKVFNFSCTVREDYLRYELEEEDIIFVFPLQSSLRPKIRSYHTTHIADVLWQRGMIKEKANFYKLIESA